jgi:nitrile hydratase accessory protein
VTTDLALDWAPRKNGELVFDEPWQARAFGIAIAVTENRDLAWDDFRHHLMASVGDAPERPYWESWLAALETWLAEIEVVHQVAPPGATT